MIASWPGQRDGRCQTKNIISHQIFRGTPSVHAVYPVRYAQGSAWHEYDRRQDNGRQVNAVAGLAM
jgi:hypothetical protein